MNAMVSPAPQVFELFPTPVMRVAAAVPPDQVAALRARYTPETATANGRSEVLSHSALQAPAADPLLAGLMPWLGPHLVALGELMFGERLPWLVKEMWVNRLLTGGHQSVHNHANCFISGVLYLSASDPSAQTVFVRGLGGREFVFSNHHPGSRTGPFNADRWVAPAPQPGDLLLFPSYLLHEVPTNQGGERMSLAFNAIPQRLDAWGYAVSLAP